MYIYFLLYLFVCVCVCALFLSATAYFHVFSFFSSNGKCASDPVTFLPSREIFIVILVLDLFFIRYCILPSFFLVWHLPFFGFHIYYSSTVLLM